MDIHTYKWAALFANIHITYTPRATSYPLVGVEIHTYKWVLYLKICIGIQHVGPAIEHMWKLHRRLAHATLAGIYYDLFEFDINPYIALFANLISHIW